MLLSSENQNGYNDYEEWWYYWDSSKYHWVWATEEEQSQEDEWSSWDESSSTWEEGEWANSSYQQDQELVLGTRKKFGVQALAILRRLRENITGK